MPKKLNIGIIGCGAIGTSLAKAVRRDFQGQAVLTGLCDLDAAKSRKLSQTVSGGGKLAVPTLERLIRRSDLVIEAASSLCSWDIAQKVLSRGRQVIIMSAGGVASRLKELDAMARKNNSRVYIPSGAIAGVDALKAASTARVMKVTLTTRKGPQSFSGVESVRRMGIDLGAIKKDTVLFSGPAEKAVKLFPQNINVAAVLSLAGIGAKKTMVKVVASPAAKKNIHEIEIISQAGRIVTRTENIPHPANPKTSFLAVLSAIALLKQILAPVRIGT
ncbi:MAG: aspartate dehydrogenase [Candidatus Omnitrophota bacterium]